VKNIRSFINIKKKIGPKIEPCGTPNKIGLELEVTLPILVFV